MVRSKGFIRGFTLIELMITLVLVGVLALMAGPFTITWLHLSDIHKAKSQLYQAHSLAKAVALRNSSGRLEGNETDNIAATIQLDIGDSTGLQVVANGTVDETLWQTQLPNGVSLVFEPESSSIGLDTTGRFITDTGRVIYHISKGGQSEAGEFY